MARWPHICSRKFMMTQLIQESEKYAAQNGIPNEAIKGQLPIDTNNGTVSYKNKVVLNLDFAEGAGVGEVGCWPTTGADASTYLPGCLHRRSPLTM